MKKLLYPLLIVLCLSLFSCETENTADLQQNNETVADLKGESGTQERNTVQQLENAMQWTSFITANILFSQPDLRQHFEDHIDNDRIVNITNLLYTDVETHNPFRDEFVTSLRHYIIIGSGHPQSQTDHPRFPTHAGGGDGEDLLLDIEGEVEGFFEYILDENCLEIYVPNVLNYASNSLMVSTSHPLNNDSFNEGYKLYSLDEDGYQTELIDFVTLIRPKNRLITRPIRAQAIVSNCTYPEYPGIDFTLFPNN